MDKSFANRLQSVCVPFAILGKKNYEKLIFQEDYATIKESNRIRNIFPLKRYVLLLSLCHPFPIRLLSACYPFAIPSFCNPFWLFDSDFQTRPTWLEYNRNILGKKISDKSNSAFLGRKRFYAQFHTCIRKC